MLLPHGYEGQGPDHSSARIERFLAMAAEDAFTVAQPSTPASYFHLLRKHALQVEHRPLIVFTPKSMLRSKAAASDPADFTDGSWRPVIPDDTIDGGLVERVLLCSGRVTWDLYAERSKREDKRTAIVRLEQLYPRPLDEINAILQQYPNATQVRWVQDEPANQGPWPHVHMHFAGQFQRDLPLHVIARAESSTTAVGSHQRHVEEQEALMEQAFS